jgi:maltose/moltooligosaccharide transporter
MPADETVTVSPKSEDAPLQSNLPPLPAARTFWYSLANLGCGMFLSFNNAALPLFLKNYTNNAIILGLMGSTHSVEGAIIQPLVGTVSDRHRSRYGRRRPFVALFIPISALFLAMTPLATSLPESMRLAALVACIFAFTVTFNIAFDPYQALMPDITPVHQRGRVIAVWTLLGVIGQASILMLPLDISIKFYLIAAVMVVTALLACLFVPEQRSDVGEAGEKAGNVARRGWKETLAGIASLKQAFKGLLVFGISGTGIGAVLPFLTLFVQKITNCSDQQAQNMFMVLMLSTAFCVIPCGWIADRIGARTMLIVGLALIGAASLCGLWVNTLSQITLVLAVAGIGNAAQSAAAYPLMTQLVPEEEVGWYTGLQTFMLSIAQPITVIKTGQMINDGSYRAIFVVCSICMALSLALLVTVSQRKANSEITTRRAAMGLAKGV